MKNTLIFANTVNELMIDSPDAHYALNLSIVTPRKIWLANNDDIIITPVPIPEAFKAYACSVTQVDRKTVKTFCPKGDLTEYLSDRLYQDNEVLDSISNLIRERKNQLEMLCFAKDRPALHLAKKFSIPVFGYQQFPPDNLIHLFYKLNTKVGFRHIAEQLGFKVCPGIFCEKGDDLLQAIVQLLSVHQAVIVKNNRGSNGFAHWVIKRDDVGFFEKLSDYLQISGKKSGFVVEALVDVVDTPSVEMIVDNHGPRLLYVCNQKCINNAYLGMTTPPRDMPEYIHEAMIDVGYKFGEYVFKQGFRGIFDIDACLDNNNEIFFTETNFRRTAGSFIDALARKLVSPEYYKDGMVWIQDARCTKLSNNFMEILQLVINSKLSFNAKNKTGVILYVDTLEFDRKVRYVIFAADLITADFIEQQLVQLLRLK